LALDFAILLAATATFIIVGGRLYLRVAT